LWSKHNAEYGFYRNLLACRILWVIIAVASFAFSAIFSMKMGKSVLNPASIISLLSLVCAICVGWFVLPTATKRLAEAYAESAWTAFLQATSSDAKAITTGGQVGVRN